MKKRMQICAGLGAPDDYAALAAAGADELFMGYVPLDWLEKYGNFVPLNRREVLMHGIQAESMDEMRLLARRQAELGVPVALAFNSLYYLPEQYGMIGDMLAELLHIGFGSCILADPALMLYLRANGYAGRIHLSGEAACINTQAMRFWQPLGISRWIFPRKITPDEMARCIEFAPEAEFEAFVLNERCHYSGAFCNSLHCDELDHLCQVEYRPYGPDVRPPVQAELSPELPGAGGCGLCALSQLRDAGVTHLKLVGRGKQAESTVRDIRLLRSALDLLQEAPSGEAYRSRMQAGLFPEGCSRQCYYL